MHFFKAKRFAKLGYHIRRAVWVEDVDVPLAGHSGKRVTAWLAYAVGAWLYRLTDGTADRVVEEDDIDVADLRAVDWTLLDAEGSPQMPPDPAPDSGPTVPPM